MERVFLALALLVALLMGTVPLRSSYSSFSPHAIVPKSLHARFDYPSPHPLYAPDTDPDYIAQVEQVLRPHESRHNFLFHWIVGVTAHGTGGSAQGDSLRLTWSIVPDGTLIPGGAQGIGEPPCNSILIEELNTIYGAGVWQAEIQEVLDEWGATTGNHYSYEANDDGAAWPTSRGALGIRGDIRISGCAIDGDANVLAYNLYPTIGGDMKLDLPDAFYGGAVGGVDTGFHYVIAHEHGHGVGLAHVCPGNGTKLMEPIINLGFYTLQHDDVRGAQRGYGDRLELPTLSNDSAATATDAGILAPGQSVSYSALSIDDPSDQDWIQFTVAAASRIDLTVAPVGYTYEDGDQMPGTGQCLPGNMIDSKAVHNLDVEILDSDGVTVLATGNMTAAGMNELLTDVNLGGAGVKYIRLFSASPTEDVQLYDLTFAVEQPSVTATPTATSTPTGIPPTQTATPTVTAPLESLNLPLISRTP